MTSQNLIKRSPSMNETHYSPSVARPTKTNVDADDTVYENVAATTQNKKTSSTMTMTHSTEKNAMSTQTENAKPGVDAMKLFYFVTDAPDNRTPLIINQCMKTAV